MERTFKDPDGGGKVIDAAGGLQGGDNDRGRRNKVVGESIVQVALDTI
jgi:hypothetical protein